jgi:putative hydrolase of the HAD superfamily
MQPTRAVLLDAMGTLIALEPPWPRLAAALGVGEEFAERAFRAEIAFYRRHAHEASDAAKLAGLRQRCAAILTEHLGREVSVEAMLDAIRFRPFGDAAPALEDLRRRGLRLVCVSNWDAALPEVLARTGLAGRLDGVVTSAQVGSAKPGAEIFSAALELVGCAPREALHVGDSAAEDVAGAHAAGVEALLLDRSGGGDIASLAEIVEHLRP